MQARHGVLVRRETHRQDGHREELPGLVADLAPEVEELVERDAELLDVAAEVLPEQLRREDVDARRHRRVRREDVSRRRDLARLGEREVLVVNEVADLLERHERGVPFVDVPDRREDADLLERAQTADAEDDLLLQARLVAAAVEPGRDLAVGRLVLGKVRVEEQERHAADFRRCGRGGGRCVPRDPRSRSAARRRASRRSRGADRPVRASGTPRSACRRRRRPAGNSPRGRRARRRRAGTPRSLADFRWSPARTPSPPA